MLADRLRNRRMSAGASPRGQHVPKRHAVDTHAGVGREDRHVAELREREASPRDPVLRGAPQSQENLGGNFQCSILPTECGSVQSSHKFSTAPSVPTPYCRRRCRSRRCRLWRYRSTSPDTAVGDEVALTLVANFLHNGGQKHLTWTATPHIVE